MCGDILRHNGTGGDDRIVPNRHSRDDRRISADPDIFPENDG